MTSTCTPCRKEALVSCSICERRKLTPLIAWLGQNLLLIPARLGQRSSQGGAHPITRNLNVVGKLLALWPTSEMHPSQQLQIDHVYIYLACSQLEVKLRITVISYYGASN
jgi:hypothetical protein